MGYLLTIVSRCSVFVRRLASYSLSDFEAVSAYLRQKLCSGSRRSAVHTRLREMTYHPTADPFDFIEELTDALKALGINGEDAVCERLFEKLPVDMQDRIEEIRAIDSIEDICGREHRKYKRTTEEVKPSKPSERPKSSEAKKQAARVKEPESDDSSTPEKTSRPPRKKCTHCYKF